jgi:hypothetical protein
MLDHVAPRRLAISGGRVLEPSVVEQTTRNLVRAAWQGSAHRGTATKLNAGYSKSELARLGVALTSVNPIKEIDIPFGDYPQNYAKTWPEDLKQRVLEADPTLVKWLPTGEGIGQMIIGAWQFVHGGSRYLVLQHGEPATTLNGGHSVRFDILGVAGPARGRLYNIDGLSRSTFIPTNSRDYALAKPFVTSDGRLLIMVEALAKTIAIDLANGFTEETFTTREETEFDTFYTDQKHNLIVQKNRDGQFFFYRSGQATPFLAGRVEDDELIVYDPRGYYASSYEGAHFVHVRFGGTQGIHSFYQFASTLHRPDIIKSIISGDADTSSQPHLTPPPSLEITSHNQNGSDLRLNLNAASPTGLRELLIYQDGRQTDRFTVSGTSVSLDINIAHQAHVRRVTAVAVDAKGYQSPPASIDVQQAPTVSNTLHVVAVGIDRYKKLNPLAFAGIDARSISQAISKSSTKAGYYRHTDIIELTDEEATPQAILGALQQKVREAKKEDTILLFFAGHAARTPDGRFFMATVNSDTNDLPDTALNWQDVASTLERSSARVLVIIDACHSGQTGVLQSTTNDEAVSTLIGQTKTPILVLAASKGRQFSEEMSAAGGGVFTQAIVRLLGSERAQYDRNHNGVLEISELYSGVKRVVTQITNGRQTPWLVRQELAGDFALF